MPIKSARGDLLALAKRGDFDVVVQGCNCFHGFGSGIAAQIKRDYPSAWDADKQTPKGDRNKLGTFSFADVSSPAGGFVIVNAYTQFRGGRAETPLVDYDAVRACMKAIKAAYPGKRLGLPKIGAGAAGGDWNVIKQILDDELGDVDATVVEYAP
ncbi:MAG TPA: phosphatase [Myxococcota bacterium]|jgi:O-acetyl-ADP-ribose deacetylase (regulator of RNase III)